MADKLGAIGRCHGPAAPAQDQAAKFTRIEDARKRWESKKPLEELKKQDLERILEAAKNWPTEDESESDTREPADLAGYKLNTKELEGALEGARLIDADLRWADLWGAQLRGANLWKAKLQGAMLARVTFEQADVTDADFRDADLGGANLASVTGLRAEQLAGTKLTNAKLPPNIEKFERLSHVENTSHSASMTFFGMLAASLYSWLTIATTRDVELITDRASSPLPIINTPISLAWFYWVAPLILVSVYIYLHLYLQRLWQDLSALPAVFTDGEKLDEKAYPWLLNGLVSAHFVRLKRERRPLSRLEYGLAVVLAWGVVPVTVLGFWLRYLPRHDWGTWLHVALVALAAGFGVYSYRLAVGTLRDGLTNYRLVVNYPLVEGTRRNGLTNDGVRAHRPSKSTVFSSLLVGAILALAVGSVSLYAKSNPTERAVIPGYRTVADLRDAEVSVKPANWTGLPSRAEIEIAQVKGADLRDRDLRHASAAGAFLVKARLNSADLAGAQLHGADLRNADLSGTQLQGVDLRNVDLSGADLREANLGEAKLHGACRDEKTQLPEEVVIELCAER